MARHCHRSQCRSSREMTGVTADRFRLDMNWLALNGTDVGRSNSPRCGIRDVSRRVNRPEDAKRPAREAWLWTTFLVVFLMDAGGPEFICIVPEFVGSEIFYAQLFEGKDQLDRWGQWPVFGTDCSRVFRLTPVRRTKARSAAIYVHEASICSSVFPFVSGSHQSTRKNPTAQTIA